MKSLSRSAAALAVGVAGAFASTSASAVNIATDGIGEVAIAPYYTVRDGWQTFINLTNTSPDPILVKVRFHEALNSRDVLDFNVAMSGRDSFVGRLVDRNDGNGPVFIGEDTFDPTTNRPTCTIPSSVVVNDDGTKNEAGTAMKLGAFAGTELGASNDDGGPQDIDRLREGYIEFIVMGRAKDESGSVGRLIEDHDCDALDTIFGKPQSDKDDNLLAQISAAPDGSVSGDDVSKILDAARDFGEPVNALKFNFRLVHPTKGIEAGNSALTFANFFNLNTDGSDVPLSSAGADDSALNINRDCNLTRGDGRSRRADALQWLPTDAQTALAGGTPQVNGACPNFVTMQFPLGFLEPSLNDAFPAVAGWWDDQTNASLTASATATTAPAATFVGGLKRGVDAVTALLQRSAIINEWTSNVSADNTGVTTDWIVTSPTKGFYVDRGEGPQTSVTQDIEPTTIASDNGSNGRPNADLGSLSSGNGNNVAGGTAYDPFIEPFAQKDGTRSSANSCVQVAFSILNRSERALTDVDSEDPVTSPEPLPEATTKNLCYESTVITFNGRSALEFGEMESDGPLNRLRLNDGTKDTLDTGSFVNGWMRMNLNAEQAALPGDPVPTFLADIVGTTLTGTAVTGTQMEGLPVTGLLLKVRNQNDVTENFASSTDHGYERVITP